MDIDEVLNFIRGIVRPLLTLTGWGVLLYLAITTNGEVRTFLLGSLATMVGFWFASRQQKGGSGAN